MEGKFSKSEKIILIITFASIVITLIVKSCMGIDRAGAVVAYGFFSIMIYLMLLVVALFPATWRMTSRQKAEIKDVDKYQSKYRKVIVILDFIICIFFNVIFISIK